MNRRCPLTDNRPGQCRQAPEKKPVSQLSHSHRSTWNGYGDESASASSIHLHHKMQRLIPLDGQKLFDVRGRPDNY